MRVGFLNACDKTTVYRAADYLVKRNTLFALDDCRDENRRAGGTIQLRPDFVEYDGLFHQLFLHLSG